MKKHLITFFIGLAFSVASFAQAPLETGQVQLNAGFGLSGWGVPIYAGAEFGVADNITAGGDISFRQYNEGWWKYDYTHTIITISGYGNYHFNELLEIPSYLDFYAGLSLGYSIWNTKYKGPGPEYTYNGNLGSGLYLYLQAGGRYFFTERFAANLQLGAGSTAGARLGITYIIK
ncbi:MAG: hypothetical protein K9G58_01010 [Bacteroidales bacterium]|nr:hypothetical protein [Bacteroidales bacterium]MCF8396714.1 hypothetical protein [Bacteroidales bacterium]